MDEFVALSGVAKHMITLLENEPGENGQEVYFADHWKSNLNESLLWTLKHERLANGGDEYLTRDRPTGSWLAFGKPVDYDKGFRFSLYSDAARLVGFLAAVVGREGGDRGCASSSDCSDLSVETRAYFHRAVIEARGTS